MRTPILIIGGLLLAAIVGLGLWLGVERDPQESGDMHIPPSRATHGSGDGSDGDGSATALDSTSSPLESATQDPSWPEIVRLTGICVDQARAECGDAFEWSEQGAALERGFRCGNYACDVAGNRVAVCIATGGVNLLDVEDWARDECQTGILFESGMEGQPENAGWTCQVRDSYLGLFTSRVGTEERVVAFTERVRTLGLRYSARLPAATQCGRPGNGACRGGWAEGETREGVRQFVCADGASFGVVKAPRVTAYVEGERDIGIDVVFDTPPVTSATGTVPMSVGVVEDVLEEECSTMSAMPVEGVLTGQTARYRCAGSIAEARILPAPELVGGVYRVRVRFCETESDCETLRRWSGESTL